jgi:hypothetical protein
MSIGTAFSVGSFLLSGVQFFQARANARATEKYYDALARDKRLEGRVKAVEAKEKAVEVLRRTKIALASNIAGGYASGVNPYFGSINTVNKQQVLRPGALDVGILEMQEILDIEKANREARNLEMQGDIAKRQGYASALGNLAMAGIQLGVSGALQSPGFVGGQSAITPPTPMARPSSIGGSFAPNASQINTAGNVAMNRAVNPMFVGQTKPLSGGVYNTAGGGMV